MSTKYNKSRSGSWWPIKQYRFDITEHPVNMDGAAKTKQVVMSLSANEKQILKGLGNILSCKPSVALRIALSEADNITITTGSDRFKRDQRVKVKMTGDEGEALTALAKQMKVSQGEALRRLFVSLAKDIRADKVKRIGPCKQLSQLECIKEWGKNNKDRPKGSKLTALNAAAAAGREAHEEKLDEEYQYWGEAFEYMNMTGESQAFVHDGIFDADSAKAYYTHIHAGGAREDEYVQELLQSTDRKAAIQALAKQHCRWWEDGSDKNWKDYLEDAEEEYDSSRPLTEEELEECEDWFNSLEG